VGGYPTGAGDSEADRLLAAFARWAADERVGAAADARRRERWLRQQASEEATLVGTLVDLAEEYVDVAIVVGARTVTGRITGVGRDALVLADHLDAVTVVALAPIVAVRVAGRRPGAGEASGTRPPAGSWSLADALDALAAERNPVRLGVRGGELLSGEVVAVGDDVVTLRLASGGQRVHVAVAAIETTTLR
jgi:hypothetical protein